MAIANDDSLLRDLLGQAAELPPDRREHFLAVACAHNPDMRTRIQSLLDELDQATEFLVDPTIQDSSVEPPHPTPAHGHTIDRYQLLEPLGEGGMGTVYRARQLSPVRRDVALKVIKLGMDTARVIARFEAERQALAMMDHPSIAKVLDAGATETGRPFFVMELVHGVPITDYCDQNKLTIRDRLDLFVQVCHAVQHAHQKGIIHRDLKPSNVLVAMHDDTPVPKVIDFGIAKATAPQLSDSNSTRFTELWQPVGTPMYMSPEQLEDGVLNIDTRADLYALGVLLYELLAGRPPFDPDRIDRAPRNQLRQIIAAETPPRPSARVHDLGTAATDIARLRGTSLRALHPSLRQDLDWIVMRCLEKDPPRRYETANALARDIERHLCHEPVEAGPPSNLYLIRKFVQRHRSAIATASVAAILLAVATAFAVDSLWQTARASRAEAQRLVQQRRADAESQLRQSEMLRADQFAQVLRQVIHSAQPTNGSTGQDLRVTDLLKNASLAATVYLRTLPETEIDVRLELATAFADVDDPDEAEESLLRAYHLACSGPEGQTSTRAVQVAADLARYLGDIDFARQTYESTQRRFGQNDPITQRAASSLTRALTEQNSPSIDRADSLREAEEISRRLIDQITALPLTSARPEHFQYMNQLATLLNARQKYAEAAEVAQHALDRGARSGRLRDSTRASLGLTMVEALRGQGRLQPALDWARKTLEFDRATIGTSTSTTTRTFHAYLELLSQTGKQPDQSLRNTLELPPPSSSR